MKERRKERKKEGKKERKKDTGGSAARVCELVGTISLLFACFRSKRVCLSPHFLSSFLHSILCGQEGHSGPTRFSFYRSLPPPLSDFACKEPTLLTGKKKAGGGMVQRARRTVLFVLARCSFSFVQHKQTPPLFFSATSLLCSAMGRVMHLSHF